MPRHQVLPIFAVVLLCVCSRALADSTQDKQTREQAILQVQSLIETGNLAEADRLLTESAKQFPDDPGFDNLRGILAAQQGDYPSAKDSFEKAIKRSPRFTNAYLNLGRIYQEHPAADPQALHKALDIYSHVLRYEPANPEANYQSAVLLLSFGEYQRSLNHVAQLPDNVRATAQTLSILCADHVALGHRDAAEQTAAQLIGSPDFSEMDASQALPALTKAKRDDLVISLLTALDTRNSLSPSVQHAFGLAYERIGKFAEARAALEKSLTKDTLSVPWLVDLARVAHKQQDYQGALGYLAHARDLQPTNAAVHYDFGMVCVDLNLVAEARNSFEKAVHLEPENPSYNYAMGATSAYRHDPAEAVPYFKKYLELRPDDPRAKLALGDALFRAKDYDGAIPWLDVAAKSPETAASAHYYLGSIALQEQRHEDALHELQEALKLHPDYADALAVFGEYFLLKKDYTEAAQQLEKALAIAPDHFAANFHLLTLYTRTNDPRREEQAKRFAELQKLRDEKTQEYLRIVQVRPFDTP